MGQRSKKKAGPSDDELDEWLGEVKPPTGCRTCSHAAGDTLKRLLGAMVRRGSHNVTLRKLHGKLQELHPDYHIGYWGFRDHLYTCERELYEASKKVRTHA